MYKLFLCLRYLRSRVIAWFAVVGVALCVAMVLIVVSVMNGFLHKVESAAKGLFGDIIVSSTSLGGIAKYDEFIAELKREVPEIEAATPYIESVAIVRIPNTEYRHFVRLSGVYLPGAEGGVPGSMDGYAAVTDFEQGLFVQEGRRRPGFDPSPEALLSALERERERVESEVAPTADPKTKQILASAAEFRERARWRVRDAGIVRGLAEKLNRLLGGDEEPAARSRLAAELLADVREYRRVLAERLERIAETSRGVAGSEAGRASWRLTALLMTEATIGHWIDATLDPLAAALEIELEQPGSAEESLRAALDSFQKRMMELPDRRVMLGLGIPQMIHRTPEGETVRVVQPGNNVVLYLVPLGRSLVGGVEPVSAMFTVVDDCRTDVHQIDSSHVYVPFRTLQALSSMDLPPRCNRVLIKVRPEDAGRAKLDRVRAKVARVWEDFSRRDPSVREEGSDANVLTWRQWLADFVGQVESQRTLVVIMFAIISLVAIVLIFVIFYMIVMQKTRDIGVLKAIGASQGGVAAIFLAYGAAIGLVGSVIGTVIGCAFVRNINAIADALSDWFGFQVWRKEYFLFERIPNEVDPTAAGMIVLGAMIAGLLGALIPAIRAAGMQPVEALRYE